MALYVPIYDDVIKWWCMYRCMMTSSNGTFLLAVCVQHPVAAQLAFSFVSWLLMTHVPLISSCESLVAGYFRCKYRWELLLAV